MMGSADMALDEAALRDMRNHYVFPESLMRGVFGDCLSPWLRGAIIVCLAKMVARWKTH